MLLNVRGHPKKKKDNKDRVEKNDVLDVHVLDPDRPLDDPIKYPIKCSKKER